MKVTKDGSLIKILPTGLAENELNLVSPRPRVGHVTYSFTDTEVFVHDLFHGIHESCLFADFEGDIAYTTPTTISLYLDTLLEL